VSEKNGDVKRLQGHTYGRNQRPWDKVGHQFRDLQEKKLDHGGRKAVKYKYYLGQVRRDEKGVLL